LNTPSYIAVVSELSLHLITWNVKVEVKRQNRIPARIVGRGVHEAAHSNSGQLLLI